MYTVRGLVALGFLLAATSTLAQPVSRSTAPLELGLGVDAAWFRAGLYLDEPVLREPMAALRFTAPFSSTKAFEFVLIAGPGVTSDRMEYRTKMLYVFEIKHTIWERDTRVFQVFGTYGAAAVRRRVYSRDEVAPLPFLVAGVGVQWRLASRAALRLESQAGALLYVPVGGRLSAGLSVPLNRDW